MIEFSTWDIVRNLLLAARWTIVLSLVAFVGGALMGTLALMMRTSRVTVMRRVSWAWIAPTSAVWPSCWVFAREEQEACVGAAPRGECDRASGAEAKVSPRGGAPTVCQRWLAVRMA